MRLLSFCLALLLGYPSLKNPQTIDGEATLATYRGGIITKNDFDSWWSYLKRTPDQDRELAIQELAISKSMAAEAVRRGWDRESTTQVELAWKANQFVRAALRKAVFDKVKVPLPKIEEMYQNSSDRQNRPRKVRLRNIYKKLPAEMDAAAKQVIRQKMADLRQRLLAGEDFAVLAEAESESQTRLRKGIIGNVPAGTLRPEVDAVAMAMKPGEISKVIETEEGLTLLYCEKIIPEQKRTEQEFKQKIAKYLKKQLQNQAWLDLEKMLLERARIQYHWSVLEHKPIDTQAFVARSGEEHLTVAQLKALAALANPAKSLSELKPEQRQVIVDRYFIGREMQLEAERRGLMTAEFKRHLAWERQQGLAYKLMLHLIGEQFKPPTDKDLKDYFQANSRAFIQQEQFDLSIIQWTFPSEALKETYRKGEIVHSQLIRGDMDFETAAKRHSGHNSAKSGGRLGWVNRSRLGATGIPLLKAVLRLEPGQRSGLVQHEKTLWILKLHGRRERRPKTFEEAKDELENKVGTAKARALEVKVTTAWLKDLHLNISMDRLPKRMEEAQ